MSWHKREGEEEVRVPSSVLVWCYMPFVQFLYILSLSLPLSNQAHSRVVDHDRPLLEQETELECWR